jgi:myo-inositol-1(or 4)-monophosphatase
MNLQLLRSIGKKLLREISSEKKLSKTAIGIGASGDKTYQVDWQAEEIILSALDASGDALTIVSEETGIVELRGGGKKVLVDPVDGSRNAVSGIPFYCTSLAVAGGDTIGDIELAYIINLVNGDEFWAEKGNGAFLNAERIRTQQDDIFYLVAYEAQTPHKDIRNIMPVLSEARKTRCLGATALDLSYLAGGSISIFIAPSPSRSFDFAGGGLLVKEAGGICTGMNGEAIDSIEISLKKSSPLLVAGNQKLHEKALRFLNR